MNASALSDFPATDVVWREVVDTPAVVIDLDVVERNLKRGADAAAAAGLAFRPHIKTHKIPALAKAQLALGAVGITAQKISEAEVMADAGISDILISFNILGDSKLRRLASLHDRTTLRTVADSRQVVAGLARYFRESHRPLGVLVEIDGFMNRCGVVSADEALQLAQELERHEGLRFDGFMVYPAPDRWNDALEFLSECKEACESVGISPSILSTGGTPDMLQVAPDGRATEYRAGSYIYNDRSLVERGAVELADCALSVFATVVSTPAPGRAAIDAGSKILSSDLFGMEGFGQIKGAQSTGIAALSEEHGHLTYRAPDLWKVGQKIEVIPNHCCVVSNLVDQVTFVRGRFLVGEHTVSARGTVR